MTKVYCMCATCWISKSIINGRNTNCECGSKDDHHTPLSEALFLPMKSPSNCTRSYKRWFSRALYFSYRCGLNLLVCALWLSLNAENDIYNTEHIWKAFGLRCWFSWPLTTRGHKQAATGLLFLQPCCGVCLSGSLWVVKLTTYHLELQKKRLRWSSQAFFVVLGRLVFCMEARFRH